MEGGRADGVPSNGSSSSSCLPSARRETCRLPHSLVRARDVTASPNRSLQQEIRARDVAPSSFACSRDCVPIRRGTQQDILNAMGSIYAATLFIGITNATAVQPVVSIERFVSYRERAAGMYAALSFAFAQVSIELPYLLAQTLICGTIFYSMASFEWKVQKFLWYIFFMYFTLLNFSFFGMMMMAITPNLQVAPIIAAPFFIMWNLFSGFLIPWKRLPEWWSWYYWANPLSWSLNGLLTSQFGDVEEQIKLLDGVHLLSVKQFLDDHFGFGNDLLGIAGVMVVCFCLLFALVFSVAF